MTVQPELAGVPFATKLAGFGDRIAVRTKDQSVSYGELAGRIMNMVSTFGSARRLIGLEVDNTLESLVVYLAALSSGNPLLILPAGSGTAANTLLDVYDPDIVVRASDGKVVVDVRREETRHELHRRLRREQRGLRGASSAPPWVEPTRTRTRGAPNSTTTIPNF